MFVVDFEQVQLAKMEASEMSLFSQSTYHKLLENLPICLLDMFINIGHNCAFQEN